MSVLIRYLGELLVPTDAESVVIAILWKYSSLLSDPYLYSARTFWGERFTAGHRC